MDSKTTAQPTTTTPSATATATPAAASSSPTRSSLKMTVAEVLSTDAQFRYPGVDKDLHALHEIHSTDWDFQVPTIVSREGGRDRMTRPRLCANVREFKDAFEQRFPLLAGLNLKHLLVAGGAVSGLVVPAATTEPASQDVDLFVHGLSDERAAEQRVEALLNELMLRLRGEHAVRNSVAAYYKYMFTYRVLGLTPRNTVDDLKDMDRAASDLDLDEDERVKKIGSGLKKQDPSDGKKDQDEDDAKEKEEESDDDDDDDDGPVEPATTTKTTTTSSKRKRPLPRAGRSSPPTTTTTTTERTLRRLNERERKEFCAYAWRVLLSVGQKARLRQQLADKMKQVRFVWNGLVFTVDSEVVAKELERAQLQAYTPPRIEMTRTRHSLTVHYRDFCCCTSMAGRARRACHKVAGGRGRRDTKNEGQGRIQIIFRLYRTVSEVLHGFDIGAAAMGYDGQQVWLTTLSRFAAERRGNTVDLTRRSPTYEARLIKYARRGWDLFLPDFDMKRLGDASTNRNLKYKLPDAVDLPYMPFVVTSVAGNRITIDRFLSNTHVSASDYGDGVPETVDTPVPRAQQLAELNLRALLAAHKAEATLKTIGTSSRDQKDKEPGPPASAAAASSSFFFLSKEYDPTTILSSAQPHITVEMVNTLYDGMRSDVYKAGCLHLATVRDYLTVASPAALVQALSDTATPTTAAATTTPSDGVGATDKAKKKRAGEILDALFLKQRELAVSLVRQIPAHLPIQWLTKNPGQQLTSSIYPTPISSAAWYGSYGVKATTAV